MTDASTDLAAPAVPSGMVLRLQEVLRDTNGAEGLTLRYRFVAPDLAARRGVDDGRVLLADMTHLCTAYAVPHLTGTTPAPSQVIISISELETVFGEATPETIQVFEGFRLEGTDCIWEPF